MASRPVYNTSIFRWREMADLEAVSRLRGGAERAFWWCEDLPRVQKMALAVGFAALIGLAAQVRIPVPWSPVPVTGQTFAVLLAGVMLGRNWAGFGVGFYAAAGALGLPWFQGMAGGLAYLAGPTGGYVVGFVAAAVLVGYAVRAFPAARTVPGLIGLMLFANFAVIHGLGLFHLSFVTGGAAGLSELLWMGVIPFIPGAVTKAVLAAAAATVFLPRDMRR